MNVQETRKLRQLLCEGTGRRILSALNMAEHLRQIGVDVTEEHGADGDFMVLDGQKYVEIYTSEQQRASLDAESRGGYVEDTPEWLVEDYDFALALYELCFPDGQTPEQYRGRGRTYEHLVKAFDEELSKLTAKPN